MIRSSLMFVLFSFGFNIWSMGCSAPPPPKVVPGPAIPGLNLTGGYDCVQFGFMKLKQGNNVVRGTYEGVRNNGDNGTIVGKIEGDIVWVDWVQPGNLDNAILPQRGKGWWRVTARGKKLSGMWGHGENRDDGGAWTAERSEFYE